MELKYSKNPFDGYTHRFIVEFKVDDDCRNDTNRTIYSNSSYYTDLIDFIDRRTTPLVRSYRIIHRTTKEQDDVGFDNLLDF